MQASQWEPALGIVQFPSAASPIIRSRQAVDNFCYARVQGPWCRRAGATGSHVQCHAIAADKHHDCLRLPGSEKEKGRKITTPPRTPSAALLCCCCLLARLSPARPRIHPSRSAVRQFTHQRPPEQRQKRGSPAASIQSCAADSLSTLRFAPHAERTIRFSPCRPLIPPRPPRPLRLGPPATCLAFRIGEPAS